MNGGYVSLDFLIYNDIVKQERVLYHVPGSFKFAKSLYELNKPIFGSFKNNSIFDETGSSFVSTYTGSIKIIDNSTIDIYISFIKPGGRVGQAKCYLNSDDTLEFSVN